MPTAYSPLNQHQNTWHTHHTEFLVSCLPTLDRRSKASELFVMCDEVCLERRWSPSPVTAWQRIVSDPSNLQRMFGRTSDLGPVMLSLLIRTGQWLWFTLARAATALGSKSQSKFAVLRSPPRLLPTTGRRIAFLRWIRSFASQSRWWCTCCRFWDRAPFHAAAPSAPPGIRSVATRSSGPPRRFSALLE